MCILCLGKKERKKRYMKVFYFVLKFYSFHNTIYNFNVYINRYSRNVHVIQCVVKENKEEKGKSVQNIINFRPYFLFPATHLMPAREERVVEVVEVN